MTRKRRTAVERWNHAIDEAYLDDAAELMKAVLAMTDEEVEAELVKAGVDLAAFDAKVAAEYERIKARHAAKTGDKPKQS
jgi:phage terminase large subunit-like protein